MIFIENSPNPHQYKVNVLRIIKGIAMTSLNISGELEQIVPIPESNPSTPSNSKAPSDSLSRLDDLIKKINVLGEAQATAQADHAQNAKKTAESDPLGGRLKPILADLGISGKSGSAVVFILTIISSWSQFTDKEKTLIVATIGVFAIAIIWDKFLSSHTKNKAAEVSAHQNAATQAASNQQLVSEYKDILSRIKLLVSATNRDDCFTIFGQLSAKFEVLKNQGYLIAPGIITELGIEQGMLLGIRVDQVVSEIELNGFKTRINDYLLPVVTLEIDKLEIILAPKPIQPTPPPQPSTNLVQVTVD